MSKCSYSKHIFYELDLTVIKFGKVFGNVGGYSTDDSKNSRSTISHYISSISLTSSSERLNSIRGIYSSSSTFNTQLSKSGVIRGSSRVYSSDYRNDTFNVTERDYTEEYPGFVLGYVRGGTCMSIERLQFIWYKL